MLPLIPLLLKQQVRLLLLYNQCCIWLIIHSSVNPEMFDFGDLGEIGWSTIQFGLRLPSMNLDSQHSGLRPFQNY
ncbi:MAG: hypothetical protein COB76_06430 [Alphaproteobacteria bacterium]|nr:MAG: hypothetical protein COB76_06430 [Alphaproteobacteria bacterium]